MEGSEMMRALLLSLALAGPAAASDFWSPSTSRLTIVPDERCVARIKIYNDPQDMAGQAEGVLSLGGFSVRMVYQRDVTNAPQNTVSMDRLDRFTAYPPEGYIAIPQTVEIIERMQGEILICRIDGVGA